MTTISRRTVLRTGAAAAAATTFGIGRASTQSGPIGIGMIQSLSGPSGSFGKDCMLGCQIAVDQINKEGGILGRQLELVARDDKGTPNDALAALRELSSSGVKLIVGSITSPPSFAALPVLQSVDAVWVMPGGTSLSFTHDLFTRNYFRSSLNAHMNYFGIGKLMAERYPEIRNWGAAVTEVAATQQAHALFNRGIKAGFAAKGISPEFTPPVAAKFGAPDYRNQIATVRGSQAQGLLLALIGSDALTFYQQAMGFGLQEQIKHYVDISNGLDFGKGLKQNLPPFSYSPQSWHPSVYTNPISLAFDAEAKKRHGLPLTSTQSAQGHQAVMHIVESIAAAKSTDTNAVIDAMETITFKKTVYGDHRYRKEDHQALVDAGWARFEGTKDDQGWKIAEIVRMPWRDIIEPAGPGQKFDYS